MEQKARGRNDSALPCPICKEEFRNDDQVLPNLYFRYFIHNSRCSCDSPAPTHPVQVILSCSHVFHEACIRSFERFTGIKACPLCRSRDYQKKRTWTGKELFRQKSLRLLQAAFRCSRARRILRHLQDTVVPKEADKRQQFWAKRLAKLTDSLLLQVPTPHAAPLPFIHPWQLDVQRDRMLDALFAESDNAMAVSRSFFGSDSPPPATVGLPAGAEAGDCSAVCVVGGVQWKGIQWQNIWKQAQAHGAQDCPICMMEIDVHDVQRQCALTSCSHLFHRACLESFEEFGKNKHELAGEGGVHIDKCPMCRSQYFKAALQPMAAAPAASQRPAHDAAPAPKAANVKRATHPTKMNSRYLPGVGLVKLR